MSDLAPPSSRSHANKGGRPAGRKTARDLTDKQVKALTKDARVSDNLYAQVTPRGSKSFIMEYVRDGEKHWIGLGKYPVVSLADARAAVFAAKQAIAKGEDPRAAKSVKHSFREVAALYITSKKAAWTNARYPKQVGNNLTTYAFPKLGDKDVAAITTEDVLDVLTPIWTTITPTAVVIRGYIANVLAYAKAMKWRSGENPAAWAENLEHLLAAPAKIIKPKKYPSLHWKEIGEFMATLHQQTGVIFRAMEVLILTGLRSNEVVGARWSEINLTQGLWAVPAVRMKERVAHTVPLPPEAVTIFQSLPRCGELVFGELGANDLRELALAKCLRTKPYYDQQSGKLVVTHGFRASLSTWATDAGYDPTLIEVALAHAVGTEVSRRYQRSDMIARRAEMMAAWAKHCG